MAKISEPQTRFCVVWETKIKDQARTSFTFENLSWNFVIYLKSESRPVYYGSNYVNKRYNLFLLAPSEVNLQRQYRVTTLLEKEGGGNVIPHVCSVQTVNKLTQVLWDFRENDAFPSIRPGYTAERLVKFVCLLECDLPCPVIPHSNEETIESPGCFDIPPNLERLSLDFNKLLMDQVFPDVKLKTAEGSISAHRAVLSARSEIFAAMFRNKMVESENGIVDVADLDFRVLELLVKYIYTGQIQGLSKDLLLSLYAAADKYAVLDLKKSCSDWMIANLTTDNCFSFLILADAHSDTAFKNVLISFICTHEAILQSKVWLDSCEKNFKLSIEVYQRFALHKSRI